MDQLSEQRTTTLARLLEPVGHCLTPEVAKATGDILNRVALRNDQFIIERKGKPLAAVVPVERLEQMRRAARMHLLQVLERQQGKLSEAQADRIANEAKHRTRKARHR